MKKQNCLFPSLSSPTGMNREPQSCPAKFAEFGLQGTLNQANSFTLLYTLLQVWASSKEQEVEVLQHVSIKDQKEQGICQNPQS